jgi:predicted metal-dependent HD superfamily phosphohydrolase
MGALSDFTGPLAGLGCDAEAARAAFADLSGRYGEPHRHYHTLEHVAEVLRAVRELAPADPDPALLLAAWFHDVIYDPRAGDNEERSAGHARAVLEALGVPEAVRAEAARLILLTRTHSAGPDDLLGQVLLDADLGVLGAFAERYDRYAAAIRREYAWVPEDGYRAGRRRVLESFLARPRIYATDAMFARGEAAARANLRREIATFRD